MSTQTAAAVQTPRTTWQRLGHFVRANNPFADAKKRFESALALAKWNATRAEVCRALGCREKASGHHASSASYYEKIGDWENARQQWVKAAAIERTLAMACSNEFFSVNRTRAAEHFISAAEAAHKNTRVSEAAEHAETACEIAMECIEKNLFSTPFSRSINFLFLMAKKMALEYRRENNEQEKADAHEKELVEFARQLVKGIDRIVLTTGLSTGTTINSDLAQEIGFAQRVLGLYDKPGK